MQTWHVLYVLGGVAELAGIVALGFPDLLPGARWLSGWLRRQWLRAVNGLRRQWLRAVNVLRWLGRREPRRFVLSADAGGYVIEGAEVSITAGTSETTLEGQVAYLLKRDEHVQREASALAARVDRLEAESPRQIAEAQRQMEQHVAAKLAAAAVDYRALRIAGTGALVLGLVLVTVATFIA